MTQSDCYVFRLHLHQTYPGNNCMLIPGVNFQGLWQMSHMVTSHANPPLGLLKAVVSVTLQSKILISSLEPLLNKPVQSNTIHYN